MHALMSYSAADSHADIVSMYNVVNDREHVAKHSQMRRRNILT